MPSVASEPPALKPAVTPVPRSTAAPQGAPASPFESLLDDGAQAAAPPPPARSNSNKPPATQAKPSQPPAAPAKPSQPPAQSSAGPAPEAADDAARGDSISALAQPATTATAKTAGDAKANGATITGNVAAAIGTEAPASGVPAPLSQTPVDAQPSQTPGDTPLIDPKGGGAGKVKADAKAATQAVAADALKPTSDDKPADSSKAPDDAPAAADAAQPPAAINAVAAVIAPVTPPMVPSLAKPAAATAAIVADDTPKAPQGIAQPLQATGLKPASGDKTDEKPATQSAAKPQPAAADKGKQAETQPAAPADRRADAAQAPVTAGTPTATAKAAEASPPAILPAHSAAPAAQPAAPAAPAAQPAPQAAAIPLSGVAVEIAGKALAGKNRFEIRLDPPELGRIEVRLDVDRDGRITSHVVADRRDTLDLLQRDASGLQRALQDAGLKTSDNGLQFSLRDQSSGQQQPQNSSTPAPLAVEDDSPIDAMPSGSLVRLSGGLDIRV